VSGYLSFLTIGFFSEELMPTNVPGGSSLSRILTLFGTRPEVIKLAPVIRAIEENPDLSAVNVSSSQHTDLLRPFTRTFGVRIDHDLEVMRENQTPNEVCARVLSSLGPILDFVRPDMILVQGDTTTAMAGALCAFHHRIPVGHVEAGLRSGDPINPFPEEMNRRLISQVASYHFASTEHNRQTLLAEGVTKESIFVTGNPVVDSLNGILDRPHGDDLGEILAQTSGFRRLVLTTHRRESLGDVMRTNLEVLLQFVEAREDIVLIFPVHPNPSVVDAASQVLSDHPRIHLIDPLDYADFIHLLSEAWLIVSDSGGVQEEAPTLGKPVLVIRENTERPEAVEAGFSRLVGGNPQTLADMLEEADSQESWITLISATENPFGHGDSGERIATIVANLLQPKNAPEGITSATKETVMEDA
jgi:UDP-N-acetylglucosamine 2-epimerase (non-hydrolysing)